MNREVYGELEKQFPEYFGVGGGTNLRGIDKDYYDTLFKNKEIYVWGIGKTTQALLKRIPYLKILAFVDDYAAQKYFQVENTKYPVILPEEMDNNVFCIVSSVYYDKIKRKLEEKGKVEGLDFLSYRVLLPTPSEMIEKMLFSERIADWECDYYTNTRRLSKDGSLGFCMNTPWLNPPNGNVFLQSYEEICGSLKNKLIQISIEKGLYCFCNQDRCNPLRESKKNVVIKNTENNKENCVIAAFDRTCNLYCESCRNNKIVQTDPKVKYLKDFFIKELLPDADIVNCAGDGEALFSRAYLDILKNCKEKKIIILSNGTLANKEKVDFLSQLSDGKVIFALSVDAARKETYENLRRGACFDTLMENIRYIGEQVKSGRVRDLVFNYVISKKNYDEISEFTHMAKEIGASAVNFTLLGNWGTFTEEEYKRIRVTDDEFHPLPELITYMNKIIASNKEIKIFFCREYDFRNYINHCLCENI